MRFPPFKAFPTEQTVEGKLCRNCRAIIPPRFRHYCSTPCRHEFTRNHWWPLVREDVLRRDCFRCSICGKRRGRAHLDVDHIIPLRMGADPFEKNNLRTLCKDCHKAKTRLDNEAMKT
ncbi:MAG: HNH endonuclease signature motif containing protein [Nanoarchaeota archaeon]